MTNGRDYEWEQRVLSGEHGGRLKELADEIAMNAVLQEEREAEAIRLLGAPRTEASINFWTVLVFEAEAKLRAKPEWAGRIEKLYDEFGSS